jgi:tellurite methyltransferase
MSWTEYYKKMGLEPRPTLLKALEWLKQNPPKEKTAIDLGCGVGQDTLALLDQGWKVIAVDNSSEAIELVLQNAGEMRVNNLTAQCKSFEEVVWSDVYLINASLSLPFCPREKFETVWCNIVRSIQKGGVFTGNFFGVNDDWKELMLVTSNDINRFFAEFEIIAQREVEDDKPSATGPIKHWHIFEVVAQKK